MNSKNKYGRKGLKLASYDQVKTEALQLTPTEKVNLVDEVTESLPQEVPQELRNALTEAAIRIRIAIAAATTPAPAN